MSIQGNYDVVIVGAGPVGMATAAFLKAQNRYLRVCVLDKRMETKRHYGLNLSKDSMKAVRETLERIPAASSDREIQSLISLTRQWSSSVQKVSVIEAKLRNIAEQLGVYVVRKNAFGEFITEENFDRLLEEHDDYISDEEAELCGYFAGARVIVGADGAHSVVRQKVMGPDQGNLVGRANLGYFIEVKYEVSAETRRRNMWDVKGGSWDEGVNFETMGRGRSSEPFKPATVHFFVGQSTYESFDPETNNNPWNLETLRNRAQQNPKLNKPLGKIEHYLRGVEERNGVIRNVKIKRLPISIYRSGQSVQNYKGKIVALAGDSNSGLVLARGVNKGFFEASELSQTISRYLNGPQEEDPIPEEFLAYQGFSRRIYANEKKWAEIKTGAIRAARRTLNFFAKPVNAFRHLEITTKGAVVVAVGAILVILAVSLIFHFSMGTQMAPFPAGWTVNDTLLKILLPASIPSVLLIALLTKGWLNLLTNQQELRAV